MRPHLGSAARAVVEALESRTLLSGAALQAGGELLVQGDAAVPNHIQVTANRKFVQVRLGKTLQKFAAAQVQSLLIQGGAASDVITIGSGVHLPTTINGAGGNDRIIGGVENDTITTGPGSSIVRPGRGTNYVDLSAGQSTVFVTPAAHDTVVATGADKIRNATRLTDIVAPPLPQPSPLPPNPPTIPDTPTLPSPPSTTPPELIPGAGFTGPTPQPAAIGSGFGSSDMAIARWDLVPYQTFTGTFNVGVVAFHNSGISHVDFSVSGGAWTSVTQMTLNPQTNVTEYTAQLNAADFPDGQVEVRAIAYPTVGIPRVLDSLNLFTDTNGTLAAGQVFVSPSGSDSNPGTLSQPFASISKALSVVPDGGSVVLEQAGTYAVGAQGSERINQRWITVEAAPGLAPSQVVIAQSTYGPVRPFVHLVRWEGLSFDFHTISQYYPENGDYVWFDNARWFDSAGWSDVMEFAPVRTLNYIGGSYTTDSTAQDMEWGFIGQSLVRSSSVDHISSDAFQNSTVVINCTADTVSNSPISGTHNDLFQEFGNIDNVVVYGVTATNIVGTQNIFLDSGTNSTFKNMAFVNISVQNLDPQLGPPWSQLTAPESNILLLNITTPEQPFSLRTDLTGVSQLIPNDVVFENCQLGVPLSNVPPGVVVVQ